MGDERSDPEVGSFMGSKIDPSFAARLFPHYHRANLQPCHNDHTPRQRSRRFCLCLAGIRPKSAFSIHPRLEFNFRLPPRMPNTKPFLDQHHWLSDHHIIVLIHLELAAQPHIEDTRGITLRSVYVLPSE